MATYATITAAVTVITEPISNVSVVGGTKKGNPTKFQAAKSGTFRVYSGNRVRMVTSATDLVVLPQVTMEALSDAQVLNLFNWRGLIVLFRDMNGTRVWGSYLNPAVTYYTLANPSLSTVTFDFQQVTFDETTLAQFGGS